MTASYLPAIGQNLRKARKQRFPKESLDTFALRIGVSRAMLQKMEKGDLSVTLGRYYAAARLLGLTAPFDVLLEPPTSLFND